MQLAKRETQTSSQLRRKKGGQNKKVHIPTVLNRDSIVQDTSSRQIERKKNPLIPAFDERPPAAFLAGVTVRQGVPSKSMQKHTRYFSLSFGGHQTQPRPHFLPSRRWWIMYLFMCVCAKEKKARKKHDQFHRSPEHNLAEVPRSIYWPACAIINRLLNLVLLPPKLYWAIRMVSFIVTLTFHYKLGGDRLNLACFYPARRTSKNACLIFHLIAKFPFLSLSLRWHQPIK